MLKKTGRMDKVNRKIEMGGEVIKNPLYTILARVGRSIELIDKRLAFDAICTSR